MEPSMPSLGGGTDVMEDDVPMPSLGGEIVEHHQLQQQPMPDFQQTYGTNDVPFIGGGDGSAIAIVSFGPYAPTGMGLPGASAAVAAAQVATAPALLPVDPTAAPVGAVAEASNLGPTSNISGAAVAPVPSPVPSSTVASAEAATSALDDKVATKLFALMKKNKWSEIIALVNADPSLAAGTMSDVEQHHVSENFVTNGCMDLLSILIVFLYSMTGSGSLFFISLFILQHDGDPPTITSKGDVEQRAALIKAILTLHPKAAGIPNGYGSLPLHVLAQRNCKMKSKVKEELIDALMQAAPKTLQQTGGVGLRTPLHIAFTDYISPKLAKRMIDAGPGAARMKDKKGWLPIHVACSRHASPEKLSLLLEAYPESLHEKTKDGETIMMLAKIHSTKSHPNTSLLAALRDFLLNDGSPQALAQIAEADAAKPKGKANGKASGKAKTKATGKTRASSTRAPKVKKEQVEAAVGDDDCKMPALPAGTVPFPDAVPELLTPDRDGGSMRGGKKRTYEANGGAEESMRKRGRSLEEPSSSIGDAGTDAADAESTGSFDVAAGLLLQLASPLGRKGSIDPQETNQVAFI
eukprot:CAMPEP_0178688686 /NCGR_PEP_ID=MMETSP0699-20121125/5128_1 /TAXON_ID=265572 /ORGANISM="Extubocellulus spinifer, Strain CCMP396" /LENGTH=579 /DNA_ID=CAMNT_0020333681 /DNA_START=733 /DNA_END=2472 /DNA_ORIENTATION=-